MGALKGRSRKKMKRPWIRAAVAACVLAPAAMPGERQELEEPVRLQAGGRDIDTGEYAGHSGPLFADYDGDGLKDLLVGNLGGFVQLFRNVGTKERPEFADEGLLKADGEDVSIHNISSVGLSPQFADFDADGRQDMITGCIDGGAYLLRGKEGGLGKPEPVRDKVGAVLRLGRYWDYAAKDWVGVKGSKFKRFHGISAFPVDWDSDGDLDLLLGSMQGRVFLRLNEGSAKVPAFAVESLPVAKGVKEPGSHVMPVAADWDGDGLWDLVTGTDSGAVHWYRNAGRKGAPAFKGTKMLVEPGRGGIGQHVQVAVADFDADGWMDLLVGDSQDTHRGWVWLLRRKPAP